MKGEFKYNYVNGALIVMSNLDIIWRILTAMVINCGYYCKNVQLREKITLDRGHKWDLLAHY